ncbi:MAG: hypothetical protein Tsb0017_14910 [Geothermobacteraceae bacterium]
MKKWRCTVCGYIHEGEEPPAVCPVCGADRSRFEPVVETEQEGTEQPVAASGPGTSVADHLHPILAHFPNGLMPSIFFLLIAGWLFGRGSLDEAVLWLVGLVTAVVPLNLLTGVRDWKRFFGGVSAPIFRRKIILALVLGLLGLAALAVRLFGGEGLYPIYLFLLAGMLAASAALGYLGGQLMFGSGHKGRG